MKYLEKAGNVMKIIAEIGTSHSGDLKKAQALIDTAVEAGADYVKFQWVYADEILHPNTGFVNLPGGQTRLYDRFKALEVSPDFFRHCLEYTHSKGAKFMCSPFGLKSFDELTKINPDAIKIASPELNHIPLLKAVRDFRKKQKERSEDLTPLVLSSGVSTLADIEKALSIVGKEKVCLLHCITSYPAPEEEYNIKVIPNLSKIFGVECGISDHSLDPVLVPVLAASFGGTMIEKHITLSKKTDGLDDPVALEGEEFAHMTYCIHQCQAMIRQFGIDKGRENIIRQMEDQYGEKVQKIIGDGIKKLADAEKMNYGRTNRSIHYLTDMRKGQVITEKDISILRTEKVLTPGLSPEFFEDVIGFKLTKDVKSGEGVSFEHFKD